MAIRHGIVASSVALPPIITINSTTNVSESRATFNATVNPNGYVTSVKFQYKLVSSSTWTDGATITGITGGVQSVFSNQTGLNVNASTSPNYDVRAIATNIVGETTSGTTSFATWRLLEYTNGTQGGHSFTVPTITPTGQSPVIPSILNVFILGGGGGAGTFGGGAGGGYRLVSSRAFTNTSNTVLSLTVGSGGSVSIGGTGVQGGTTQITASNFSSIDAGGGTGGLSTGGLNGGNVGYGDNPGYGGGAGASFTDTGGKVPFTYTAGGGGAGINGGGGNATANAMVGAIGGNGGSGGQAYGYNGGAGGGGTSDWASQHGSAGGFYGYGSGGSVQGNGTVGFIRFQYYGA
jgi:hypothetical protein